MWTSSVRLVINFNYVYLQVERDSIDLGFLENLRVHKGIWNIGLSSANWIE